MPIEFVWQTRGDFLCRDSGEIDVHHSAVIKCVWTCPDNFVWQIKFEEHLRCPVFFCCSTTIYDSEPHRPHCSCTSVSRTCALRSLWSELTVLFAYVRTLSVWHVLLQTNTTKPALFSVSPFEDWFLNFAKCQFVKSFVLNKAAQTLVQVLDQRGQISQMKSCLWLLCAVEVQRVYPVIHCGSTPGSETSVLSQIASFWQRFNVRRFVDGKGSTKGGSLLYFIDGGFSDITGMFTTFTCQQITVFGNTVGLTQTRPAVGFIEPTPDAKHRRCALCAEEAAQFHRAQFIPFVWQAAQCHRRKDFGLKKTLIEGTFEEKEKHWVDSVVPNQSAPLQQTPLRYFPRDSRLAVPHFFSTFTKRIVVYYNVPFGVASETQNRDSGIRGRRKVHAAVRVPTARSLHAHLSRVQNENYKRARKGTN